MADVAIIGAGDLGAAIAHRLASLDRVAEIRLIDTAATIAQGKALDIQQSGPIEGFRTRVTASGDVAAALGARAVVLADVAGAPAREWQGEEGLALLKRLAGLAGDAVFVCAGASQRLLVERGVSELKIARARIVGSAPAALVSAVRAIVALEARRAPDEVSLSVLGVPPDGIVVAWQEASIGGDALTRVLDPPQIARLEAKLHRLWPPGPYALASAAARVSDAIVNGSRRTFCAFVALDGELGARGRAAAVPAALGMRGVERVVPPSLSVQERVAFENALARAT